MNRHVVFVAFGVVFTLIGMGAGMQRAIAHCDQKASGKILFYDRATDDDFRVCRILADVEHCVTVQDVLPR